MGVFTVLDEAVGQDTILGRVEADERKWGHGMAWHCMGYGMAYEKDEKSERVCEVRRRVVSYGHGIHMMMWCS